MQPTLSLKPFLPFPLEAAATHTHALRLFSAFPAMDPMQKALLAPFHLPLPPRKRHVISCNVCQLRFNSESQATAHYKGGKHAKRLKALEISKAKQAERTDREPAKDGSIPTQVACVPAQPECAPAGTPACTLDIPSHDDTSDSRPSEETDGNPVLAESASSGLQAQRAPSDGVRTEPGGGPEPPSGYPVDQGPRDPSNSAGAVSHADEPAEDSPGAAPRRTAQGTVDADPAVAPGIAPNSDSAGGGGGDSGAGLADSSGPSSGDPGSSQGNCCSGGERRGMGANVPCCSPTETDGAKPSKLSPSLPSSTRSGADGPAEDAKACGDAATKDEDDKGSDARADGDEKSKAALFCSLCKVALNSQSQMEAHNNGSMHKTLLEAQSGGGSIKAYPRPGSRSAGPGGTAADPSGLQNKVFHCEMCDVRVNSETQLKQHITSRRHKDRVAGKPPKPKFSPYTRVPCTAGIISAELAFPKDMGKAVAPGFFATAAPALTPQLTLRASPHHASLFSAGPALLRPAPGPMRSAHGSILFAPY